MKGPRRMTEKGVHSGGKTLVRRHFGAKKHEISSNLSWESELLRGLQQVHAIHA